MNLIQEEPGKEAAKWDMTHFAAPVLGFFTTISGHLLTCMFTMMFYFINLLVDVLHIPGCSNYAAHRDSSLEEIHLLKKMLLQDIWEEGIAAREWHKPTPSRGPGLGLGRFLLYRWAQPEQAWPTSERDGPGRSALVWARATRVDRARMGRTGLGYIWQQMPYTHTYLVCGRLNISLFLLWCVFPPFLTISASKGIAILMNKAWSCRIKFFMPEQKAWKWESLLCSVRGTLYPFHFSWDSFDTL